MDLQDRAVERQLGRMRALVVGDSHAQGIHYAVVEDALHLASPGESMIQTYYRLKRILEKKPPRLERVILSVGVHSLLETKRARDELNYWARVVDHDALAQESPDPWAVRTDGWIGRIGFLGDGVAIWMDSRTAFRSWMKGEPARTWEGRLRKWDGPESTPDLTRRSAAEIEAMTRRVVRAHVAYGSAFDPLLASHFDRILALCRSEGLAALAVEMPVTPAYLERMAASTDIAAHDRFVRESVARHGADLLDLRSAFDDPALFIDPEHLSHAGRDEATRRVRRHLGLGPDEEHP